MAESFTWLHLSDIHVHRSHEVQGLIMRALVEDLRRQLADGLVPSPNAVLVTGDVAFSGQPEEYSRASTWLTELLDVVGLRPSDVFLVPGNHDVDRRVVGDPTGAKATMLALMREGQKHPWLALEIPSSPESCFLTERFAAYRQFAGEYRSELVQSTDLSWSVDINPRGHPVRLVGLNSALLSQDDAENGTLRMGDHQVGRLRSAPDGVTVFVLCHHPLDWLADGEEAHAWMLAHAQVQLVGHMHRYGSVSSRFGGGNELVQVSAGAAHSTDSEEIDFGYSVGRVEPTLGQRLYRVWPRTWNRRYSRFDPDSSETTQNRHYAQHYSLTLTREVVCDASRRMLDALPAGPVGSPNSVVGFARDCLAYLRGYHEFLVEHPQLLVVHATPQTSAELEAAFRETQVPVMRRFSQLYAHYRELMRVEITAEVGTPLSNEDLELVCGRHLLGPTLATHFWRLIGMESTPPTFFRLEMHVECFIRAFCQDPLPADWLSTH